MPIIFLTTIEERKQVRNLCWDQENSKAPDILTSIHQKAIERAGKITLSSMR